MVYLQLFRRKNTSRGRPISNSNKSK